MTDDIRVKIHNDLIIKDIERETNYAIKCDYDFVYLNVDDVKTLLENYKKQSKEIEELKQEKEYLNCIIESDKDNYINKDKIKAKIEELEKQDRENRMSHNYLVIPVLQSLLEKE